MNNIMPLVKEEVSRLEKDIREIEQFLTHAPEGCLKWQNKAGKTYYMQQYLNMENQEQDCIETTSDSRSKSKRWARKYIKKSDMSLASALAQKQYYMQIKNAAEKNLKALKEFVKDYKQNAFEEIYDKLNIERKVLIAPIEISKEERLRKWEQEVYEKNNMFTENLRYETEQGDLVRSKSEVIIANILYQNRKDISYKYERPLNIQVNGRITTIYPDYTIINLHTGKVTYWEHAGRMDDPHYADDFVKKINTYIENDIIPGRDVIFSYESMLNPLEIGAVKRLVKEMISK